MILNIILWFELSVSLDQLLLVIPSYGVTSADESIYCADFVIPPINYLINFVHNGE